MDASNSHNVLKFVLQSYIVFPVPSFTEIHPVVSEIKHADRCLQFRYHLQYALPSIICGLVLSLFEDKCEARAMLVFILGRHVGSGIEIHSFLTRH
jgi:hypothetical protein